jgi:phage-related tail fiber protein
MLWYDTLNNTIFMRSEADDAWIKIGELDQSALTFAPENAVPSGAVVYLARSTAPSGWLKANGAAVSRTTYSKLFSAISTTWGSGDGSTTFNLPDLRGEFLRGWDDGRGVDSGRSFSSSQLDQMQRIQGQINGVTFTGSFAQSGAFNTAQTFSGVYSVGGNGTERAVGFDSGNSPNARVSADSSGETRPRNRALLACIKF